MKRKADDDPTLNNVDVKLIKTEKDGLVADYSQDVKKKITASARTGQACDRCRVGSCCLGGACPLAHHFAQGPEDAVR